VKRGSSLNRLLDGLFRAPHDYRTSTNVFPDLDPVKLAKEFELEARGKKRAAGAEPTRGAGQLDDVESQIIEHVKSAQRNAHQILDDELQSYAQRLGSLHFQERVTAIKTAAPDCIVVFRAERSKGEKELRQACTDLLEHAEEHKDFRNLHRLKRPARVHSTAVTFLKWGFLVLLLAVECALNGSFLAKGNELGLVGGISEALAFAALNVGAALAAATLGTRLLSHRNYFLKFVGVLVISAWICFTALLNLALAHYREVAGTLTSEGGPAVIARLQEAPLDLADIQSWVLFGIGTLFAAAAFVDSVFLFDPYWGYGGVEKRLRKARKHYYDLHRSLVEELEEIYSDFSSKLGAIGRDLSARLGEYGRIIPARKGRVDLFRAHQGQLESAADTLLATYRKARGIAVEKPYRLERIQVSAGDVDPKEHEEIEKLVKDAQSVLLVQTEKLQAEFEQGMTEYDQIDAMIHNRKATDAAS
jgi:hypothetical protein